MATLKFRLRPLKTTTGQSDITIYLFYTHKQRQYPFGTGQKVKPDNWDSIKQRVKAAQKGATEINRRLVHFYSLANEAISKAHYEGIEPTADYMKAILQPKHKDVPITDFFGVWQLFIDRQTEIGKLGFNTLKAHRLARNKVMEVCKTNSIALTLETIDKKTGERIEEGYIKANYASGTINTHIKNLKVFLKWASENGFNVPVSGLAIKKPKAERATIQFLNEDELAKVENAVLPPSLDRHRDLFLFTCYTGLRYSDLANLKPENYKNSQLKITTIKTHHEIFIPIHPRAKDIIEKYGGKLPHPVSNQKMNDALKKIGFAAGLTDMEQIVSYKGGKRIQESLPKHELLTCHVGRRTFIIYSLQRGVRPETLMEATGHRDIRILMQYVKITPDVLAKELFTAWGQPEVQIRKIG